MSALTSEQDALITASAPFVCAYLLDAPWFERLGPIAQALVQAIRRITPSSIPLIWDGRRGETGRPANAYAHHCFETLGVDAVTLNPYAGPDVLAPYVAYPAHGHFVLCATENASGVGLQHLEISDWQTLDREPNQPLYVHVARAALQWSPCAGLVVSANDPQVVATVRAAAPERWLLINPVGAHARATLIRAALHDNGARLLVDDGGEVACAANWQATASALCKEINEVRQ